MASAPDTVRAPAGNRLLGPGDPAPYTLFNPGGRARVLLAADHAGRTFPRRLEQLGVADWVLGEHVAWDIGSRELAFELALRWDAPLVCANYSRLVIDNNRAPDDPTSCIEVSDGIAIPGNLGLDEAARAQRIREIFMPYHGAIDAQLARMARRGFVPALISLHSCTPVFDRVVRPWHFGVLWDRDPRIAVPLMQRLNAMPGLCVGDNEPYSGKDPHDYTMDTHGEGGRIAHVSLEIRQDLIDTPAGARRWADVLGGALDPILADDALYRHLP